MLKKLGIVFLSLFFTVSAHAGIFKSGDVTNNNQPIPALGEYVVFEEDGQCFAIGNVGEFQHPITKEYLGFLADFNFDDGLDGKPNNYILIVEDEGIYYIALNQYYTKEGFKSFVDGVKLRSGKEMKVVWAKNPKPGADIEEKLDQCRKKQFNNVIEKF